MHALARRFEHGAHERDGRTLAVRSRDMNDRRQFAFRMIELLQDAPHPIERQVDQLGVQRGEARQCCVDRGHDLALSARSARAQAGAGAGKLGRVFVAGAFIRVRHSEESIGRN